MDFVLLPPGAQQDELTCDMEGVPTDESNLVIKASFKFACLVEDTMLSRAYRFIESFTIKQRH